MNNIIQDVSMPVRSFYWLNGLALGAHAGEKKIKGILEAVGFSKFRRATETSFNIIYEARP